jgi:MFS family permease
MWSRGRWKRTGESGKPSIQADRAVRIGFEPGAAVASAAVSAAARYAAILRTRHVAPLLAASMLARLPFGMFALALVLYIADERGSFGVAGLVNGAFGVGAAIGSPLQSRAIDRLGQGRVMLPLAVIDALATGALLALTEAGAPTAALVACALVGGLAIPNIGAALRTLWPDLLRRRRELLPAAFAVDSVAIELLFTTGPLISAAVIALVSPAAALVLSAACTVVGVALFVAQPPSRGWRPSDAGARHGMLGALRSPGVRTLLLAGIPIGFCFGATEIALPAFASEHGAPEWAGALMSVWAAASAVGGLAYGARTFRRPLSKVYVSLAALLPLGFLPALAAPSIALMALLILPAGLLIAPIGAAGNQLVGEVAPAGAVTEAYTWPVTALLGGFAAGTAVGGSLVESVDWHACFVAASLAAALGASIAFAFRRTLAARELA